MGLNSKDAVPCSPDGDPCGFAELNVMSKVPGHRVGEVPSLVVVQAMHVAPFKENRFFESLAIRGGDSGSLEFGSADPNNFNSTGGGALHAIKPASA